MLSLRDKRDCCGCGACAQRCPAKCIRMTEDAEGFRYPVADANACTGCGLCERICPGLHPSAPHDPLRLFAARNRDEAARAAGSSGGVFSLLARRTLREGGVVFGAAFVPTWGGVSHRKAEKEEELQPLLKSKYVQSDTGGCYTEAAALLREGRRVLFSGTPCQIAGLHAFLRGERPERLLTVECLCHGVPSPAVWRRYTEETAGGRRILGVDFRDKSRSGWRRYDFTVRTDGGERRVPAREDLYMRAFLAELTLRPSCYACPFKSGRSGSDITLADFWNIRDVLPAFDDDRGASLVLLNTPQGVRHFEGADAECRPLPWDDRVRGRNGGFLERVEPHPRREEFFRELPRAASVTELLKRTVKPTPGQRLVRKFRRLIAR